MSSHAGARLRAALLAAAMALPACTPAAGPVPAALPAQPARTPLLQQNTQTPIAHVVIVVQENRSFDNFFATFPGANGTRSGLIHTGQRIALVKAPLAVPAGLNIHHSDFLTEYDGGKMDGFDLINFDGVGGNRPAGTYPYRYVDPAHIAPYWTMAKNYVLADNMFQTQSSGSFTAHQDLIAGGTGIGGGRSLIDFPSALPWGCDAPQGTTTPVIDAAGAIKVNGPFPCMRYATIRDLLDAHAVSWRYYSPAVFVGTQKGWGAMWNAFDAINKVRHGPEWTANISTPETNVLQDAKNDRLPAVSWVVPDLENSDHPDTSSDTGPSWVAQIVNAIGSSKEWNSTAIVIVWDDWGGLYDHVRPPQFDRQSLGFRVPMIVVSPYAKKGYVAHTQYEFGSILRFVEDNWQLGRIGTSDLRAKSIAGCFDFRQPARPFAPIAAKYSRAFFMAQRPSNQPVDTQ
jgi:phospholipase C